MGKGRRGEEKRGKECGDVGMVAVASKCRKGRSPIFYSTIRGLYTQHASLVRVHDQGEIHPFQSGSLEVRQRSFTLRRRPNPSVADFDRPTGRRRRWPCFRTRSRVRCQTLWPRFMDVRKEAMLRTYAHELIADYLQARAGVKSSSHRWFPAQCVKILDRRN